MRIPGAETTQDDGDERTRGPVLVLGGTGHYGREITRALVRRDVPVRVVSRNAARAEEVLGPAPEVVEGDVRTTETLARVVAGTRSVVIALSAMTPRLIRHMRAIEGDAVLATFEEMKASGVRRVVYLSGYELRRDLLQRIGAVPIGQIKLEVEAALQQSGLDWTVLGCPPSMEIFFAMLRGSTINVPGGGPPALPTVSNVDVGEIAAQCALRQDLAQRRFRLTGAEALSFARAAERISNVLGRRISVRAIPLLPMWLAASITRPFHPYLSYLLAAVRLLNAFPEDLAAQVPNDHALLLRTFRYRPTTLEMETRRRMEAGST